MEDFTGFGFADEGDLIGGGGGGVDLAGEALAFLAADSALT